MKRLWTTAHSIALGFLLGVTLMTAAIWYAVPTRAQSVTIPVQNPSFESGLAGWTVTHLDPGGGAQAVPWQNAPDGANVADVLYSSLSQDLGVQPQFGTYTLKVFIANYFYAYPGKYEVTLSIGGKEFCSTYAWATGNFNEVPLVCPMSNYFSHYHNFGYNGNLGITLSDLPGEGGWQVVFDKVSLTFTPSD